VKKERKMERKDRFFWIARGEIEEIKFHLFEEDETLSWKVLCALVHIRRLLTNPVLYGLLSNKDIKDYYFMQCFQNPIDQSIAKFLNEALSREVERKFRAILDKQKGRRNKRNANNS
jgi:hypothetical protein